MPGYAAVTKNPKILMTKNHKGLSHAHTTCPSQAARAFCSSQLPKDANEQNSQSPFQENLASVTECSDLEVNGTNDYHGGHA